MPAKIAVVMAAHNAQDYIAAAMESILAQTYSDFEFIIVENASDDSTWDIINSYTDERIRAFQTPLKQLSYNLNFGISHTFAEYIARMDCDDVALPERLKIQAEFLDANPGTGVVGSAFRIFGGSEKQNKTITMPQTDKQIRKAMPFRFCLCHPSVMFRRETVVNIGGYQGNRFCQDLDLWLRLSRDKTVRFANIPRVLLQYRIHPAQAKGTKECFAINSAQILREALIRKSPVFFAGFALSLLKIFQGGKK